MPPKNRVQTSANTPLRQTVLSDDGFVRSWHILGDVGRGLAPLFPVSQTKWNVGVRLGIYPRPIKIERVVMWRAIDIKKMLEKIAKGEL
jgi:hypothetical protein